MTTRPCGLRRAGNKDLIQEAGMWLGLDVSVSRRSRDTLRPWPRSCLGRIGERLSLGLGVEGIGLGQLGRVHKSFFSHVYFTLLTKYHNVASALSTIRTIEFLTVLQTF